MDSHKRTKSGIARSLLQRVSSSNDVRPNERSPSDDMASTSPIMPSPLSRTSSFPQSGSSNPFASDPSTLQGNVSIEHSVRMFRLYEALRGGDTAAISKYLRESDSNGGVEGTSILHLAVQCADMQVIEYVITSESPSVDVNNRDKDGNTPLHIAAMLGRVPVVRLLLHQKEVNDSITNYHGQTALDLAKNPEVFQQLQLARSMYIDAQVKEVQRYIAAKDYDRLETLFTDEHFRSTVDIDGGELPTEPATSESGGTLLHEAARGRDTKLIQLLLLNGADPFRRDKKGRLAQDVTKDDRTRAILKRSPAAAAAQRGIQEKTILGSNNSGSHLGVATAESVLGGKEAREMKGYLKKWVNYTTGYKLRWFVLEDGVLSYYKHQDDAGSACRGAINMRIAKLHMDAQDKLRFEIHGKSSVKYHLKANHQVEAKRWFWALNNAIQFCKDEAKEAERAQSRQTELLKQAKLVQAESTRSKDSDGGSIASSKRDSRLVPATAAGLDQGNRSEMADDDGTSAYDASVTGDEISRFPHSRGTTAIEGDFEDNEDYGDDPSEREIQPVHKDAFMIAAHSARLQLDLLAHISSALQNETRNKADLKISDPSITQAFSSYEAAIANLRGLIGDLGRIALDREAYWQYRLEQEANIRRLWEENMAQVAREQEELEKRIGESEEKRKQTKRALRDALEGNLPGVLVTDTEVPLSPPAGLPTREKEVSFLTTGAASRKRTTSGSRRKSTIADLTNLSDSDSDNDEEFFDAVDAGEVEVVDELPPVGAVSPPLEHAQNGPISHDATQEISDRKGVDISTSFNGYEDPIRSRLKIDNDNRPKVSLWGILKSMIGKDMTKMTLPVTFNEPTSLLFRVAEDMEYTELLDTAADRTDSTERMVYVAAFAASEYASTIGRVAKPFNPLLGETYEYCRPDKGFRFFAEQVSHHPPIGAAWAESPKWDYYGESAVKSKFYGKSFDFNPLGTWFLHLRPIMPGAQEELYTWKKVTSSVVGIITGSPTIDNYGPMEIRNWTTGEVCQLDFKQRGWKAASAFQVSGKVLDREGKVRWSIGGRWNDKIYARQTPGYEADINSSEADLASQAFLVWEASPRRLGLPFNLTPFVITLNAIPDKLRPWLPPTDTRLRPDQRAMENGEYEFAATEKNRVEEKQRAKRRSREQKGEEFVPLWFRKGTHKITGEEYWIAKGSAEDIADRRASEPKEIKYWKHREAHNWKDCENIF